MSRHSSDVSAAVLGAENIRGQSALLRPGRRNFGSGTLRAFDNDRSEIILLFRAPGELNDCSIERRDDFLRGQMPGGANHFFQPLDAELFLLCVRPFKKAIRRQHQQVARLKFKVQWGSEISLGEMPRGSACPPIVSKRSSLNQ